jgi:hypothetical protein
MAPRPPKQGYGGGTFISKLHPNASIELDEKHFAAIGRVAASWSLLEYAIDFAVNHLSVMGAEAGYCVTSQILSATYKFNAFMALIDLHQMSKEKLAEAREFQQRIYNLIEHRNRVVHDLWIVDALTGQHFRHQMVNKKTGSLMLDNIPVDLTKIEKLISDITKLRLDFVNFWMRLPSGGMFPSTSILLQERRQTAPP